MLYITVSWFLVDYMLKEAGVPKTASHISYEGKFDLFLLNSRNKYF